MSKDIKVGAPQASVLGPLLFVSYINDLHNKLFSSTKHYADDTKIFYIVHSVKQSCDNLNIDLTVINNWADQWKMSFTADPNKQGVEVVFSKKRIPVNQPSIYFNNSPCISYVIAETSYFNS